MKKTVFSLLSAGVLLSIMMLGAAPALAQFFPSGLLPSQLPLTPINITGLVTEFKKATCANPGFITINGIRIPIAQGTDVFFQEADCGVNSSGFIVPITHRADECQIVVRRDALFSTGGVCRYLPGGGVSGPGTVRNLIGYLDAQGRLVLQLGSSAARLPIPTDVLTPNSVLTNPGNPVIVNPIPTGFPAGCQFLPQGPLPAFGNFTVTGAVTGLSLTSITIGGLTFALGVGVVPSAPIALGSTIRLTGRLNIATNQLVGMAATPSVLQVGAATNTVSFCDAAMNLASVGSFQIADVNPGDAPGQIANFINSAANPVGTSFEGLFRCDISTDVLTLENLGLPGVTPRPPQGSFFVNPGFNLRPLVWTFKPACFTLTLDQFGWIIGATVTPN
jgi:hypothetical protein